VSDRAASSLRPGHACHLLDWLPHAARWRLRSGSGYGGAAAGSTIANRSRSTISRTVPLYVIPEGAGTVNGSCGEAVGVSSSSFVVGGRPSARRRGQRWSARSADERPWGRQGLTQDGERSNGEWEPGSAWCGFSRVREQLHRQQPLAVGSPRLGVPVIPSPRQGGMELCGRSRAGSIKRATTPPSGGHDTHEHAPGCARAIHIACLGAGARQRTWPSRRP
jgi:hypothetical protein